MWEVRFGLGSAVIVGLWLASCVLVGAAVIWADRSDMLPALALGAAMVAATLTVLADNVKTRRVIRSVAREGLTPVREFGRRD